MKTFRVLMTADAVGGVWSYATDLARGLTSVGLDVDLALLGPSPNQEQIAVVSAIDGVELIDTGADLDWMAADAAAVRRSGQLISDLARARNADLVHLNMPALAAEADFTMPVLAVAHSCLGTWWDAAGVDGLPADFAWRDRLHAQGLHRAGLVVTPSKAFARATQRHHQLVQPPHVIPNGRTPLTHERGAIHDFAFTAGRLWDSGKNVVTLDRAAARLAIPFKAAGACKSPQGDQMDFANLACLGQIGETELTRLLAAQPVFASAAIYEPFGLAVLEAAAAGCALVLADMPTFRELWDGSATFVDPRDDRGFADAIERLIGNFALRLACGRESRERARCFSVENMVRGVLKAYQSLLGQAEAFAPAGRAAA
ncbi:glycosyltransferase family 4 protein [Sphingomonas sp. SRS2]|uniref:glycosyltransferase family 4 protein n=1 Tax=Sphingomonas sp. SRS2 TaxID=133190 RepID=UPI000B30A2D6|nr:glycosyltransferase [Sphingomonas sp. SRS2]